MPTSRKILKVYGYMGWVTFQGLEAQLGLLDITMLVPSPLALLIMENNGLD
jgi:hypothetical protein